MRRFLPTFLIIILVLAIYPFLGKDQDSVGVVGLPWQIEILPDGSTRVFGVNPGSSTLGQAAARLGDDMELAVIAAPGEAGGLEMYYGHYRAGLLSARLVLAADMDADTLKQMRENAASTEVLQSGARKHVLSEEDYQAAYQAAISSIAFIPSTNLDHDMIINRFGEPDEIITSGEQTRHYLYAAKGLDVIVNNDARDVLQYVAPNEFSRLREPLGH